MHDKSAIKWTEKIQYDKLEKNKIAKLESEFIDGVEHDIYYTVTNADYLLAIRQEHGETVHNEIMDFMVRTYGGAYLMSTVNIPITYCKVIPD
jgi:hypothetical protein